MLGITGKLEKLIPNQTDQLSYGDMMPCSAHRALKIISQVNHVLVRATEIHQLVKEVCRIVVTEGNYRLAWVGFAEGDEEKTVRLIDYWGVEEPALDSLQLSWGDGFPGGDGPTGTAIRTNRPHIVQYITNDSRFGPSPEMALKGGFASLIALPLAIDGMVLGALNIYASEPNVFNPAEIDMLQDLAADLAYGIKNLRVQAEHEQTLQALRKSEARFRTLVNSIDDIVYELNGDQQYSGVFGRWLDRADLNPDYFLGKTARDIFGPETAPLHEAANKQALTGQHVVYEWTIEEVDDTQYFQTSLSPLWNRDHQVAGLVGVGRNITEHKKIEQQLQAERNFVSAVLDTVGALVLVLDPQGRIVQFNRTCERVTGYQFEDIRGQAIWDTFIQPGDLESVKAFFNQLEAQTFPYTHISHWLTKEGTTRLIDWTDTALFNQKGNIEYIIATGVDVTEQVEAEKIRSNLEDQLRQAQKMESIGRLAGGVAHDFNNQLTAMIGYTNLALRRLPEDNPARHDLQIILEAAERASHLTRQLLAFARRQPIEPVPLRLNDLILNVSKMLRRLIGENIELTFKPSPDLGQIRIDPGQLEQILFNLAVNARDAMPNGGKLTITTSNLILDSRYTDQQFYIKPGQYICLKFSDTGMGMTEEIKAKIFEPFFTTKPIGKGTGLGLATCFGIVKQNNGYITVDSQLGQGTTFTIGLPRFQDDPQARFATNTVADFLPHGTETILLVEDETSVRQMMRSSLEKLGYHILEASNGEDALKILKDKAIKHIDLLLTDVIMPKMGGRELVSFLKAHNFVNTKILFMSGYTGEVTLQLSSLDVKARFLQKPFSLPKLAQKVRYVLDN